MDSTPSRGSSACCLRLYRFPITSSGRATGRTSRHDPLGSTRTSGRPDTTIRIESGLRVVEDHIVTSAGVSAGIDMALSIIESICGRAVADETAKYIEYPRLSPELSAMRPWA